MRERSWRGVAAVGGLLGLVAVVAVAAAGHAPGGGESRPSAHAPKLLQDYLATAFAMVMVVGAVLLFAAIVVQRGSRARTSGGSSRSLVLSLVLLAVALVAVSRFGHPWLHPNDPRRTGTKAGPAATSKNAKEKEKSSAAERYQPQFRWLPVLVVGGLIIGIGGAMAVFAVRRKQELLRNTPIALVLSEVLSETLDDLRQEVDPRKAVIQAYARMERTLAARGLPKHESEAPLEYLTRVLGAVQASAHSVRRLTLLFQRARFSEHEIDAGMKEDAIDALSGLRAELEVSR